MGIRKRVAAFFKGLFTRKAASPTRRSRSRSRSPSPTRRRSGSGASDPAPRSRSASPTRYGNHLTNAQHARLSSTQQSHYKRGQFRDPNQGLTRGWLYYPPTNHYGKKQLTNAEYATLTATQKGDYARGHIGNSQRNGYQRGWLKVEHYGFTRD